MNKICQKYYRRAGFFREYFNFANGQNRKNKVRENFVSTKFLADYCVHYNALSPCSRDISREIEPPCRRKRPMQVAYDVRPQMAYGLRRTDCVGHDPKLHQRVSRAQQSIFPLLLSVDVVSTHATGYSVVFNTLFHRY